MDLVERAARLREERIPHVLATVVRAREPSSGKPGDRAIVTADRQLEGWVGGACAEAVVADEAVAALAAGQARYLVLDAAAEAVTTEGDRVTHPLRCHSGGAIELFIEPFTPPLTVAVVGATPVARTLAALCKAAGFAVTATSDPEDPVVAGGGFVVVATMGRADEIVARAALLAGAPYVAVVASRRRAGALRDWLLDHDVPEDALTALHAPAGLDLGARGAEGVAVSILAEIVAQRDGPELRRRAAAASHTVTDSGAGHSAGVPPTAPAPTRDPVCGMTVDPATALSADVGGTVYAFCCPHCREVFLADPARYAAADPAVHEPGTTPAES
jgi:xanthine dehydrogenase accessory factor